MGRFQTARWIVVVSLLLGIPTYGFTRPLPYAVAAHVDTTLLYVGLLLLFGRGFVIEGAIVVRSQRFLLLFTFARPTSPRNRAPLLSFRWFPGRAIHRCCSW